MTSKIVYAKNGVMAIMLDTALYFMDLREGLPRIYDSAANPMIISNIDSWIQARTNQKHSLSSFREMCYAFEAGMNYSYTKNELMAIIDYCCKSTIKEIVRRGMIYDYSLTYWIEVLGSEKIEKYLRTITDKYDDIMARVGKEKMINELRRILKVCTLRQSSARFVCERLLERLGSDPSEPVYPSSENVDARVTHNIRNEVLKYLKREHKNVDASIVEVVDGIQAG
jgi:hypothetical protein